MKNGFRFLSVAVAIAIILNISTIVLAQANPRALTTQTLIEEVTGKNSEIKRLDERIRIADDKYTESVRNKNEGSGYQKDINELVNPLKSQIEYEELKWKRTVRYDEILTEAFELYYKILLQGQLIDYQTTKIERVKRQLENKKLKISLGTEASYTLINDETTLKEAETELQRMIKDEKNLKVQLNIKMGRQPKEDFIPWDKEIPYEVYVVNDIEYVVSQLVNNNYSIKLFDKKIEATTKERNITEGYSRSQKENDKLKSIISGGKVYKSALDDLEDELIKYKYDIKDEQDNIESKARADYNTILNLEDEVKMQKLECEKNTKLVEAEFAKFQSGQIIELDYKKAQEEEKYSLYQYNQSKLNYYIAVQRFKNFIKYTVK